MMTEIFACWQCGETLRSLILPLSRREECHSCGAEQHVCKLCKEYNAKISGACEEDQAEDVRDKERANFCDYFSPNPNAYRPEAKSKQSAAETELAALFGDNSTDNHRTKEEPDQNQTTDDAAQSALDDLFGGNKD